MPGSVGARSSRRLRADLPAVCPTRAVELLFRRAFPFRAGLDGTRLDAIRRRAQLLPVVALLAYDAGLSEVPPQRHGVSLHAQGRKVSSQFRRQHRGKARRRPARRPNPPLLIQLAAARPILGGPASQSRLVRDVRELGTDAGRSGQPGPRLPAGRYPPCAAGPSGMEAGERPRHLGGGFVLDVHPVLPGAAELKSGSQRIIRLKAGISVALLQRVARLSISQMSPPDKMFARMQPRDFDANVLLESSCNTHRKRLPGVGFARCAESSQLITMSQRQNEPPAWLYRQTKFVSTQFAGSFCPSAGPA